MILVYSTRQEAKLNITNLVRTQTDETIVVTPNQEDISELIKTHRPKTVFLFMPQKTGAAMGIQTYIRATLPHCRVRILPVAGPTDLLHPIWRELVERSLSLRGKRHKTPKKNP